MNFDSTFRSTCLIWLVCWQVALIECVCNDEAVCRVQDGVKIIDNIIKPITDERIYRGLIYPNGFQLLLISDEKTLNSAMSISVDVGSVQDNPLLQGEAHLLEHMSFLGTKQFPNDSDWQTWISEKNGIWNGVTETHETMYYFETMNKAFEQTVTRFIDFFTNPLMNANKIPDEIKNVQSECNGQKDSDHRKVWMVNKATCDQMHPFSKFDIGNQETLSENPKKLQLNVHAELMEFHKKHYVAKAMKGAIYSNMAIEDLTDYAIKDLPINSLQEGEHKKVVFDTHFFQMPHLGKFVRIVPKNDQDQLLLAFAIRSYYWDFKKIQPSLFVNRLLMSEHDSGLVSYLKTRNWITSLKGHDNMIIYGLSLYEITIDLTDEGLKNYEQIITMIFEYLAFIKKHLEGKGKRFYQEHQYMDRLNFDYKDKNRPVDEVFKYSKYLQSFAFPELVINYDNYNQYSIDVIGDLLSKLIPERMRLNLISKSVSDHVNLKEHYFQFEYSVENITSKCMEKWNKALLQPETQFEFPETNIYIPTNVEIKEIENPQQKSIKLATNEKYYRNWILQDASYQTPKAVYALLLRSPVCIESIESRMHVLLMQQIISNKLQAQLTAGASVGLEFNVDSISNGLVFKANGYDQNLHLYLEAFVKSLLDLDLTLFNSIKSQAERTLQNNENQEVVDLCSFYLLVLLNRDSFSAEHQLEALNKLTVASLVEFKQKMLNHLFVEGFAFGNVRIDTNEQYLIDAEHRLTEKTSASITMQDLRLSQAVDIEEGWYLYAKHLQQNENNAISNFYLIGVNNRRNRMIGMLLYSLLNDHFYEELRLKQSLAYYLFLIDQEVGNAIGIQFYVETSSPLCEIENAIEIYFEKSVDYLKRATNTRFDDARNSVINDLTMDKTLDNKANQMLKRLKSSTYEFGRHTEDVKELNSITKEEVIEVYEKYVVHSAKKISIQIYGRNSTFGPFNKKYKVLTSLEELKKDNCHYIEPLHYDREPLNV